MNLNDSSMVNIDHVKTMVIVNPVNLYSPPASLDRR
jgi:hypothetical protein